MKTEEKLEPGKAAPDFSLPASDGGEVSMSGLRGKTVVLYFYPKDDTPGCTKEACSFSESRADLEALGAVVLGVSKDPMSSHLRFKEKYGLTFPLLSDPEGRAITAYGVWKDEERKGVSRSTFLIDGSGIVRRVWRSVKVDGHAEEVMRAIRELP